MDQVHESLDNLFTEVDALERLTDVDEIDQQRAALAVSIAKRARRHINDVVRRLAQLRDGE